MLRGFLLVAVSGCQVVFPLDSDKPTGDASVDANPLICPTGYDDHGTGFYKIVPAADRWQHNELVCENDRNQDTTITGFTHLVVIASQAEYDKVAQLANGGLTSIGMQDLTSEGQFHWVTDEDATATFVNRGTVPGLPPWGGGEPNNGGVGATSPEDCVQLSVGGDLNDYDCSFPLGFICECDRHAVIGTFP